MTKTIEQTFSVWGAVLEVGESPIWLKDSQTFAWIDIATGRALHGRPGREVQDLKLGGDPVCLAPSASQALIVASYASIALNPLPGGPARPVAQMAFDQRRFNDGCLDDLGRLWIGTMPLKRGERGGSLYCLAADRDLALVADGFEACNGLGFSPANDALYLADTGARTIYRFDFDLQAGRVGKAQPFHVFEAGQGKPDGLAVDAEGNLWVAMWDGGGLARLDSNGCLFEWYALPGVMRPTSLTFGGHDLRDLIVTTASVGLENAPDQAPGPAGRNLFWRSAVAGREQTGVWPG